MAFEIIYKEISEKYEYDVSDHLPLFSEINMTNFLMTILTIHQGKFRGGKVQILITYKTIGTLVKIY